MLQVREPHRIAVFVNWHWRVNRPLYYRSLSFPFSLSVRSLSVANERTTLVRFVMELGFGESALARVSTRERKRERERERAGFFLLFRGFRQATFVSVAQSVASRETKRISRRTVCSSWELQLHGIFQSYCLVCIFFSSASSPQLCMCVSVV